MADHALQLLLEKAQEDEKQAQLSVSAAQQSLDDYYRQLEQIEQYRLEYCRQMSDRGQSGLSASAFGHLNKFIVQLDETLAKQRDAEHQFKDHLAQCRETWQQTRQHRQSLEWLIEKREREEAERARYQEQRQMDEMAAIIARRRPSPFSS
ncbi:MULTISPECIES: flagellar export protein FliJ [Salinivibrio]|uniref:Flagellar FliJ protein n=1 Tax=Salinivibrio kushneri TaxID=1908198 RepID=A0AB36JUW7_9GAMM|nr:MULTISPECIES: flagellar export protein FliJ [Salinivibrio]OOE36803.1 flagellar protein FliJ [Salinivibrio kushneri]OOE37312.1 flagellar protein FliJ [Salinivibrio kushneri]OOE39432.1 flagellar protein FliJ [Salinivibrio kushneri]OOE54000.1 flagellar protein FliJ [Salinivibrio kushneri]OOE56567.1 flagellar protein FliJ [Salinivibrio kushneri]